MERLLTALPPSSVKGWRDASVFHVTIKRLWPVSAADRRVEVIEAPFGPNRQDLLVDLKRAAERGAIVIAREILTPDPRARRPTAATALSFCLAEPAIAVALIGTTDPRHLAEAIGNTAMPVCGTAPIEP